MALSFRKIVVSSLSFGTTTAIERGVLTLDSEALASTLQARDERIDTVEIHIALPGEATRILCTKDVIEPRVKSDGASIGEGATLVLENVAVATCGPIVGFQEGIIDMSGPGADYTPFSKLALVVVELTVGDGTDTREHEAIVRAAGLQAAEYLAANCVTVTADRVDEVLWHELAIDSGLPRIAYVDMLLSQGLLHDTYVLGRNASEGLPRIVDPRVVIDGGVVSGNCVSACDKTTTYHHQNNPVIAELLREHGKRWNFVGVVLTNVPTRLSAKQRSAQRTVKLVGELNADGAVITKEGFGNPDADLMMLVRGLQHQGIETVAVTDEYAGSNGGSQSLADTAPEADALVSVGNANEQILLPPMQRVIGPLPDVARLAGGYAHSVRDDGSMEVELQAIVGSTNQLGFGRLSCRDL